MPDLPPGLLDGSGVVALGALFTWLVMTGRLVPRRTYEDKEHEAAEWRTESRIKDQQLAEKDTQLRELSEVARTVNTIMRAMPHTAGQETS